MNKNQKQVTAAQLKSEKEVIDELKQTYEDALEEIDEEIQRLMGPGYEVTQAKVYQLNYQYALKDQLNAILDKMNANQYQTVDQYIKNCYEDGWIGAFYNIKEVEDINTGDIIPNIPIVAPIDQEAVVQAVRLNSKLSKPLYESMGINTQDLKKNIAQELSRGLSSGLRYEDISRNINNQMNIGLNKSIRIARTEGHRVSSQATMDAMKKAKAKGADIVKQWDSTMDRKTRPSHQRVDGEIREMDEKFSNGLMYPGDPAGPAAEVVNCRCVLLQRARWALDDEELETLKQRAEYFGLDKSQSFEDFKKKYLEAAKIAPQKVKSLEEYQPLFEDKHDADDFFRPWADKTTYSIGDKKGQKAIYNYTDESYEINKSLSGYDGKWMERENFVGYGKVDLKKAGTKKTIDDLTEIIEKTEPLTKGVTIRRTSGTNGLAGLFEGGGFNFEEIEEACKDETIIKFEGSVIKNHAFTSGGVAKDAGFHNNRVNYTIKCPSGTKMIYAEPQSAHGLTKLDGKIYTPGNETTGIGQEAEMIIQRNTTYRIDKITLRKTENPYMGFDSYIDVEMTVIDQDISEY